MNIVKTIRFSIFRNRLAFNLIMPVFIVSLLIVGWVAANKQVDMLTQATISAYQKAELEIVRVAARSISIYINDQIHLHNFNDINRFEQNILKLFIKPIKLLQSGDAWIYAPDHVVFDLSEDFPDEYKGKSMDQIFHIQKELGASHFENMVHAVKNSQEGVGWYIWLPEKGREIAAWTPVKVGDYTWSIGLSVPLPEVLVYTGAGKQIRTIKLTMSIATIASLVFLTAWGCGAWLKERVAEELRQREKDIHKTTVRYKSIIQTVIDGFWLTDLNGKLLEVNDACCRMSGYNETELLSMHIVDLEGNMNQDEVAAKIDEVKHLGYSRFETKHRRKSGACYDVEVTAQYLVDENEKLFIISRDISERKQMEELESQLIQAQKMESVGRLAGGVAHDFNNMLSIILGNVELMQDDIDQGNPLRSKVYEIQKAAQRSADLTRQLLTFARRQKINPKIINLNHTIEGMLKILKRLIGEDIDLLWRPKKHLWSVKIDTSQINQVLANLCVNARDAIKDTGKVTIETDNICFDEDYCRRHRGFIPGEFVLIAFSDNGCGMDKETINNLFEPFFTTKSRGKGTGLGLAIIYGIIKQHNGFVNIYSEPEQGTTFKLYLPRHEKCEEQESVVIKEKSRKGFETILLVED
ncbi:MAG: hypothetical protein CSA25_00135 [Desulfobacter postgatei]|uniref:histidine kinase n=1 Tax=Desulfobacter postgatei TaxID=2293 RepID=A0A2G6MU13_9BACT|nr:MAG: hypothetical protein CSA25_00135 [Desulfobacter postgatei]